MNFQSVLFNGPEAGAAPVVSERPAYFVDLNLDQVVASIAHQRQRYALEPFFYATLHSVESIEYRHDILRDLESPALIDQLESFARKIETMRDYLERFRNITYPYQRQRCLLDAANTYCEAVIELTAQLERANLKSCGLLALKEFLGSYMSSDAFAPLLAESRQLLQELGQLQYDLYIDGKRIRISRHTPRPDYGAAIVETFERFRQDTARHYEFRFLSGSHMNHVEEAVLDRVARLYPVIFHSLADFCGRYAQFSNEAVLRFDREIQFYLGLIEYLAPLKQAGLPFCYPVVSSESKAITVQQAFDLVLAKKLTADGKKIVCNDFLLSGIERVLVVSGANQGGKTTFARTFGQLHYLACIGCPVPGIDARVFLFDKLFTHFEQEESLGDLRSKLENDLRRIHEILEHATANSILILNESFGATTLDDALFLGVHILRQIIQREILCVSVTFFDELASLSDAVVSLVAEVDATNPTERSYKVVRRPADGLAYASAIAAKYRLTYRDIRARLPS